MGLIEMTWNYHKQLVIYPPKANDNNRDNINLSRLFVCSRRHLDDISEKETGLS